MSKSKQTYLITGSSGFIGKNITSFFDSIGTCYARVDKPSVNLLLDPVPFDEDILIHLAAVTDVRYSLNHPAQVISDNISMTLNCLEHAKYNKPQKFIFTSSIGAPYALSPYSASKMACEDICRAYRTYNIPICILRLANIYGPHSIHKQSAIHKFIKQILKKEPLTIYGNGSQTRDFVYVTDAVYSILYSSDEQLLEVSTGTQHTISDVISILSTIATDKLGSSYKPNIKLGLPVEGEIDKIQTPKTINSPVDLETGLKLTFNWYLENYEFSKC